MSERQTNRVEYFNYDVSTAIEQLCKKACVYLAPAARTDNGENRLARLLAVAIPDSIWIEKKTQIVDVNAGEQGIDVVRFCESLKRIYPNMPFYGRIHDNETAEAFLGCTDVGGEKSNGEIRGLRTHLCCL
jgi:hypothetical protein